MSRANAVSRRPAQVEATQAIGVVAALEAAALLVLASTGQAGAGAALASAAVFAAVAALMLRALGTPAAPEGFGAANWATLARAGIAALVAGLALEALATGDGLLVRPGASDDGWAWALPTAALLALVLDWVDGWLARRQRLASAFGARFDMEADALLMLALSLAALASARAGLWILVAGGLRYAFLAAGALSPALAAPLPPSLRRKAICAGVGIALVITLVPAVPAGTARLLAGAALLTIVYSFAVDTVWLLRRPGAAPGAAALTKT